MQKCNENAANRYSYVGEVYNVGESKRKEEILNSLPVEWSDLHKKGYIHIHDLDAYGLTYNCLTFNLLKDFPYERFKDMNAQRKIQLRLMITLVYQVEHKKFGTKHRLTS